MAQYEIDSLDRKILSRLVEDSRTPFLELARDLKVSGGTIHGRVNKLREQGIVEGSQMMLNYQKLGYGLSAFIGVKVRLTREVSYVKDKLAEFSEITEIYYTTGNFSLMVKAVVKDMAHFHMFLSEKLQSIDPVQSTETFMVLSCHLKRERVLD